MKKSTWKICGEHQEWFIFVHKCHICAGVFSHTDVRVAQCFQKEISLLAFFFFSLSSSKSLIFTPFQRSRLTWSYLIGKSNRLKPERHESDFELITIKLFCYRVEACKKKKKDLEEHPERNKYLSPLPGEKKIYKTKITCSDTRLKKMFFFSIQDRKKMKKLQSHSEIKWVFGVQISSCHGQIWSFPVQESMTSSKFARPPP